MKPEISWSNDETCFCSCLWSCSILDASIYVISFLLSSCKALCSHSHVPIWIRMDLFDALSLVSWFTYLSLFSWLFHKQYLYSLCITSFLSASILISLLLWIKGYNLEHLAYWYHAIVSCFQNIFQLFLFLIFNFDILVCVHPIFV